MAITVRELISKLGFDFDPKGADEADAKFNGLKAVMTSVAGAAAAMGAAISGAILHTAHEAHEIELLSQRTGENVEVVQEWMSIAKKSGTTAEAMAHSMGILGRTLLAARKGQTEAVEGFVDLGIKMSELKDATPDEALRIVADAFNKLPPGLERNAKLMKVFGRGSAEMIPVLIGGKKRLDDIAEGAHIFGKVLDEEAVKAGAELYQTMSSLAGIFPALVHVLTGPLLRPAADLAKNVLKIAKSIAIMTKEWVALKKANIPLYVERLTAAIKVLAALMLGAGLVALIAFRGALLQLLVNFALNTAAALAYAAVSIYTALTTAAAWLAASAPVIALTLAFAALLLIIEDVYVFLKGGDSLIGELGPKWTKFLDDMLAVKADDPWWLKALKIGLQVITDIQGAWREFEKQFPMFSAVIQGKVHTEGLTKDKAGNWRGEMRWVRDRDEGDAEAERVQREKTMRAIYGDKWTNPTSGGSMAVGKMALGMSAWQAEGPSFSKPSVSPAPKGSSTVLAQTTVNQTINASAGMDETTLASKAAEHVDKALDTRLREAQAATR